VHGIAFRLMQEERTADISDRQEWLWNACISELEWRHVNEPRFLKRCSCELCVPPFPD